MKEEWKPIEGYEGLYEVSSYGRVRSLKRKATSGRVLKPQLTKSGYLRVHLSKSNRTKNAVVHRLVACAFVDGQSNTRCQVNHINEVKSDNRAENLEWCTPLYNTNYNNMPHRRADAFRKKVYATKDGETQVFNSITEACSTLGVSHGGISECANGKYRRPSIKGYYFSFAEETHEKQHSNTV